MGERETVSIELDRDVVEAASAAGLDLSQELTMALHRKLFSFNPDAAERERAARQWYEDNKAAVDWYNRFIEEHGLFSDGVRKF